MSSGNTALTRRSFMLAGGAALAALAAGDRPQNGARPNIILCMTDDQGWGDVSYNGLKAIRTAALDDMAAGGLRFNRFYAGAPLCSPTRGSVMTGRHPNRYGCFMPGSPMRAQEMTIAQALRRAGYATGHFGKWHLNGVSGPGKPIAAGDPLSPGRLGFDEWLSVSNFFDLDWTFSRRGTPEKHAGDGSDAIVAEALKFIGDCLRESKPFLAVIWFGSPHNPHTPLPADLAAAGGSRYYGELLAVDRAMGRLRSELRRLGIADNTLIWFNSDNGATAANGSNGRLRGNKATLWEGGVRVPGIVEWPARIRKGVVTDVPACTSDIYPTVLELLGITVPNQIQPLDGISLVPLIDGNMDSRPSPIAFWHNPSRTPVELNLATGHAALTDNRYKLHKLPGGKWELYDLVEDMSESRDLAAAKPDVTERMKADLLRWQESVAASYRGEDYRRAGVPFAPATRASTPPAATRPRQQARQGQTVRQQRRRAAQG